MDDLGRTVIPFITKSALIQKLKARLAMVVKTTVVLF